MPDPVADALAEHLRRLAMPHLSPLDDRELLRRFAGQHDEAAFAALVRRHGGMVLGVARRVVGHVQDAEDVFQATFLVLARKAEAIREPSVAAFLHGVAARLGRKALVASARRRRREAAVGVSEQASEADPMSRVDLRQWIDAELARLPETLRQPVVLCLVEGQTQDEAARQLGLPPRTLKARLQRGREVLRERLHRHGVGAVALESLLPAGDAVPAGLAAATVRLGVLFANGDSLDAAAAPALALAGAGLRSALWARLRVIVPVLLVMAASGAGLLFSRPPTGKEENRDREKAPGRVARDLYGDPLPAGAVTRLGTVRFRHLGGYFVGLAAIDRHTLVSVAEDDHACFWEIETGKLLRRVPVADFHVRCCAFSRDGKLLAVADYGRHAGPNRWESDVRVLEVKTGKEVRLFRRGNERMGYGSLSFTPDGKILASLGEAGVFRLEEVASGAELHRLTFRRDSPMGIAFSPDGSTVAIALGPNTRKTYVWEWQTGNEPRELPVKPYGARSLSFSPDGKTLLTGDDFQEGVRQWDVRTGTLVRTLTRPETHDTQLARFSPDGRFIVSTSDQRNLVVVTDVQSGKPVRQWKSTDAWGGAGRFPTFTPDSRRVAVALHRGAIRVWDVPTGKEVVAFDAHVSVPSLVSFLLDGTAVTAGDDGSVRFWDAATGKQRRVVQASDHWVRGLATSADGRWLATSELGLGHAVKLWDLPTGKLVYTLAGHGSTGGQRAACFTPDHKHLLSWGDDRYLRRWDVRNGKAIAEHVIFPDGQALPKDWKPRLEKAEDMECSFSDDGSRLVLVARGNLYLFDTATGKQTHKLPGVASYFCNPALTPDGKHLLLAREEKPHEVNLPGGGKREERGNVLLSLLDLATGKSIYERVLGSGKEFRHARIALSRDGQGYAAAAWGKPNRIELGDVRTGASRAVIRDLPAAARGLAFSPDGKRLIAGLEDTTALIWDLAKVGGK